MKGSLSRLLFPWAVTRPEDESRAANAPPIKVLLCLSIGSCSLPRLLWLFWLVIMVVHILSVQFRECHSLDPGIPVLQYSKRYFLEIQKCSLPKCWGYS